LEEALLTLNWMWACNGLSDEDVEVPDFDLSDPEW